MWFNSLICGGGLEARVCPMCLAGSKQARAHQLRPGCCLGWAELRARGWLPLGAMHAQRACAAELEQHLLAMLHSVDERAARPAHLAAQLGTRGCAWH